MGENVPTKSPFKLSSVILGRCPACHQGAVLKRVFGIHRKCAVCRHDFYPEPGFYLGAMAVSYLVTAMLTIPPVVVLKIMGVDPFILVAYPILQFLIVGPILLIYARVIWLHVEYRMTTRLEGSYRDHRGA